MTPTFTAAQEIIFTVEGQDRSGIVEATWQGGRRAVVRTQEGELLTVRADQVGKPVHTIMVGLDLDEAERLAFSILDGTPAGESVTGQLLKLAAAVVTLRNPRTA